MNLLILARTTSISCASGNKTMLEKKIFETQVAGKKVTVEFNPIASQANGSVMVSSGGTTVLATVVMSPVARETVEYFPLTVDYEEKYYAAGRILGSRFMRREGRPSEEAILISRLIDRTIRPLFDHRMRHDVQVVVFTLSLDEENSPDVLAIPAASLALLVSDIPWEGPVSAVRVSFVNGECIINPTDAERKMAELDMIVSGGGGYINMLEGKAKEIPEETLILAIERAFLEVNKINAFQDEIRSAIGKNKKKIDLEDPPEDLRRMLERHILPRLTDAIFETDKTKRHHALSDLKHEWMESAREALPETGRGTISDFFEDAINNIVHDAALKENKRSDGRNLKEVRPLYAETGVLTRTHGSGLFFRGDTHILSVVTLWAPGDELLIEGMDVRTKKHFMHHYNFPPFSVGETGRMGSPGRREIGHGALAEKALEAIIPPKEIFPYTIRIVSETLSSNGSSSMGSVCASTLALIDAGVPITRPVTGIAMGLMMEDENTYRILTDIQGPEDHHGDMDFKVAGTTAGVTAIQMDVKVNGITLGIVKDALSDARKAREKILEVMAKTINEPRKEMSPFAPRIAVHSINPEKIRDVIGPGGKVINGIIAQTNTEIDIEQSGVIYITGKDDDSVKKALAIIEQITHEFEVGEKIQGKVKRMFDFGAMVEIAPQQEGLIHISKLLPFRVDKVTDVVNTDDLVEVEIIKIDEQGRIDLSLIKNIT